MVEQRSPKPSVACSSRVSPAKARALPHGNARAFIIVVTDENKLRAPAKILLAKALWERRNKRSKVAIGVCAERIKRSLFRRSRVSPATKLLNLTNSEIKLFVIYNEILSEPVFKLINSVQMHNLVA